MSPGVHISSLGSDRRVVECFRVLPWDLRKEHLYYNTQYKRIVYSCLSFPSVSPSFEIKVVKNGESKELSSSTSMNIPCMQNESVKKEVIYERFELPQKAAEGKK